MSPSIDKGKFMKSLFSRSVFQIAIFASLLMPLQGHAWNAGCDYRQQIQAKTVLNRFATTALGCVVQVTPFNKPDLVYRDYWFDERGRFLVYTSTSGPDATSTGYRSYFLFPRRRNPDFEIAADGGITVTLSTGEIMRFSADTTRILSFPGGSFTELPEISLENGGGVELHSTGGIFLDTGYRIGTVSYSNLNAPAVFKDGKGHDCRIRNGDVFSNVNTYYGEPNFIFPTDKELAGFLARRCPELDLSSLR